jgi:hypothetical protein
MSGSIFVQDAQGQPLMPTAPAYARILVRDGKAAFQPHPALSIVQLTHIVAEPQVQPVLVSIRLYESVASLLVFTERTGLVPVLQLAVAFQPPDASHEAFPSPDVQLTQRKLVKAVLETIAALLTVLPISHLMGANPEPTLPDSAMALLLQHLQQFPCTVLDARAGDAPPDDTLLSLAPAWSTTTRSTPVTAASVLAWCRFPLPNEPPPLVLQMQEGARSHTGILRSAPGTQQPTIFLPTAVSQERVHWQERMVLAGSLMRTWPLERLALLPIASEPTTKPT